MNGLNQEFIEKTKQKLTQEKDRLKQRIEELKAQDPYQDPEHVNDNAANDTEANEEAGHERMIALIEELTVQHSAVEEALGRIENGVYGVCSVCGNAIGEDRLQVHPTAQKCMEHA